MSRILILVVVIFVLTASALQAKNSEQKVVKADTPEKFELVSAAVRQEMAPGKRYEFLNAYNRKVVNDGLDRMAYLLDKAGTVDAMQKEDKDRVLQHPGKCQRDSRHECCLPADLYAPPAGRIAYSIDRMHDGP